MNTKFIENTQFVLLKNDAMQLKEMRNTNKINGLINQLISLNNCVRTQGLIAIQDRILQYENNIKSLLQMVIDGIEPELIIDYAVSTYYIRIDKSKKLEYFIALYMILMIQSGWKTDTIKRMIEPYMI